MHSSVVMSLLSTMRAENPSVASAVERWGFIPSKHLQEFIGGSTPTNQNIFLSWEENGQFKMSTAQGQVLCGGTIADSYRSDICQYVVGTIRQLENESGYEVPVTFYCHLPQSVQDRLWEIEP